MTFSFVRIATSATTTRTAALRDQEERTKHNFNKTDVLASNLATSELILVSFKGKRKPSLMRKEIKLHIGISVRF